MTYTAVLAPGCGQQIIAYTAVIDVHSVGHHAHIADGKSV